MSWHASWIWLPQQAQMDNLYLFARKEFDCASPPAVALAKVSGSQLYKLYVNGRYVGRGPNPADPSYYYYDVHDLALYLVAGRNTIAMIGYNYSEKLQGIIGQNWGIGGLLFELEGEPTVRSDASWKVLQAPTWDQAADMNCTFFGDYKEYYDSRQELPGWMETGFDDSRWVPARVIGKPPVAPWTALHEREIPFLDGETVRPAQAFWESASVTYAWRQDWEIYHEQRLVVGKEAYLADKFTEVSKTHGNFTPSILLDFGRLVTGYVTITIHTSAGGVIDVLYGEGLNLTRVDSFRLRGGEQVLEPFNRRTFRYLRLSFPEVPARIELDSVLLRMDTFPVQAKGSFTCSDEHLTRMWDISAYTMRLSMLDHFVDCPWRERTIYGGDVYAENPIAYYAFGDPRLNRKTLRQMFALQYPEGALPPYGPYLGVHGFYPSWSAFFGLAFVDHWQFTADRAFLDELWPNLSRLCAWTVNEISRNALPMIGTPAQGGSFQVWMAQPKIAYHPWENYPFYALLKRSAHIAGAIGHLDLQRSWSAAATRMADAMQQHLVDPTTGLVGNHPRPPGHPCGQFDGALSLWAQAMPQPLGRELANRLVTPGAVSVLESPFHGFFMLEGLFAYGEPDLAVNFMRSYWGDMMRRGATTFWEHHSVDSPAGMEFNRGSSACHGWSAAPAYACGAHLLGVRPLTPGFESILISPQPCDLSWAAGTVPTPHGEVQVAWQQSATRFHLSCQLPRPAQLVVPVRYDHLPQIHVDGVLQPEHARRAPIMLGAGRHVCEIRPR